MTSDFQEKRREARTPAQGLVRFRLAGAPGVDSLPGRLLDSGRHGFRAAHFASELASGQDVDFERAGARGRVARNRIVAAAVESGCYVLED